MEIALVRHTPVVLSPQYCYGQTDVDLTDDFPQQAAHVLQKLDAAFPAGDRWVVTSPLARCRRLAELCGKKPHVDPRLMEMNFGKWEGLPWNTIPAEEYEPWVRDFVRIAPPGGECFQALYQRSLDAFESLKKSPHERIIVIAHAGVIRSIMASILEIPLTKVFSIQLDYGSLSRIRIDGELCRIQSING
jgi:alpha-ribazole phosphatase